MLNKPLFLWAHPRSLSTAMEVYFRSRGDFQVVHEPFGDTYWQGADAEKAFLKLLQLIQTSTRPVFVKDIAHHLPSTLASFPELINTFTHLILVRQPLPAFHSHLRVNSQAKAHEFGYQRLYDICKQIIDISGVKPRIILSEQLQEDAENTIAQLCSGLGIAHLPEALNWSPRAHQDWKAAQKWQSRVACSKGFEPARSKTYPPLPEHLREIFVEHENSYMQLLNLTS